METVVTVEDPEHKHRKPIIRIFRNRQGKRRKSQRDLFLLWMIPILGMIFLWQIGPILGSLGFSFTDYTTGAPFSRMKWVGITNFALAFKDPVFAKALGNSLFFAALGVPLKNLLALFIAQLLFSIKRGSGFFRTMAFLPVVTPPLATVLLFQYLYQNQYGLLNQILTTIGLSRIDWLFDPAMVKPSIAFMMIWNLVGYPTIILLAGLGTIPEEFREAARIDGASSWQVFRNVTIPLLRRSLAYVFITDCIHWLQVFDQPNVMTQGGPVYHSLTAVMQIQRTGLVQYRGGAASALAFILFAIILVLTLFQLRFFRTEWEY